MMGEAQYDTGVAVRCDKCGCVFHSKPDGSVPCDPVNHPRHYGTHPSGIECIEITRHMNFNLGNAMKYIWRAGEKGNAIQDLEKAVWYLQDEIKRLKK